MPREFEYLQQFKFSTQFKHFNINSIKFPNASTVKRRAITHISNVFECKSQFCRCVTNVAHLSVELMNMNTKYPISCETCMLTLQCRSHTTHSYVLLIYALLLRTIIKANYVDS